MLCMGKTQVNNRRGHIGKRALRHKRELSQDPCFFVSRSSCHFH